jgi:RNA polymerase sigma-70 factor (ECF subfamily)
MAKDHDDVDLGLIRRAQQGDAESTAALAGRVRPRVCAYVYRMTLNPHVTDDLCQETMLRLVSSLPGLDFADVKLFWAWVYKTALSRVQDHVRSERHEHKSSSAMEQRMQPQAREFDDGMNKLQREELLAAVWKAMQRMTLRHRSILTLRCMDELSYAQIAAITGGSKLAAKVLFFRARQSLQRQLAKDGFGRSSLLAALGLFAGATAHTGPKAASAAAVSVGSLHSGAGTAVLAVATSKAVVATVCAAAGLVSLFGIAGHGRSSPGLALLDWPPEQWARDDAFTYPSRLLGAGDPDGDGWQCAFGEPPMSTRQAGPLEPVVLGRPSDKRACLVLSPGHWVELGFDAPVVDGDGPDILIAGWGCRHQRVTLTDGAQARFPLPWPPCEGSRGQFGVLAIDLARFKVAFEVKAVLIEGNHYFTPTEFYRLTAVRARTP